MSIIDIRREDTRVIVSITTELAHSSGGCSTRFIHSYDHQEYFHADAVLKHIHHLIGPAMQRIRQDAYNQGWKDAKAKKHGKETWFSGELP